MKRYIKSDSKYMRPDEVYDRYMVKITPYKNKYKFDYIDTLFDVHNYCFFTYEGGYDNTSHSDIPETLFDKLFYPDMEPGKVYRLTTFGRFTTEPNGYYEIPETWFHL